MNRFASILALVFVLSSMPVAAQTASSKASAGLTSGTIVNLNTATEAQLQELPGIGKATADRIVEYRQKNGGFKKAEDLMNVRGVGEKSFLKLKQFVTVTTPKANDKASTQP